MAKSDPSAFEYINRLKFASTLRYSTQHAPALLLEDNYFHNCAAAYLDPGDEIDVICFHDDGAWTKGTLEVRERTKLCTVVALLTPWRRVKSSAARSMNAVHKGFGKWTVLDDAGVEVAKNLTREEAKSMASKKRAA